MILLLIALLTLLTLALLVWPALAPHPPAPAPGARAELLAEKAALLAALRELDFDYQAGALAEADYAAARRGYETQAAAVLAALDRLGAGGALVNQRP